MPDFLSGDGLAPIGRNSDDSCSVEITHAFTQPQTRTRHKLDFVAFSSDSENHSNQHIYNDVPHNYCSSHPAQKRLHTPCGRNNTNFPTPSDWGKSMLASPNTDTLWRGMLSHWPGKQQGAATRGWEVVKC